MDYVPAYASFIAHFDREPSDARPIAHTVIPPSFGGTRTKRNTMFLNARECLHACGMLWRIAPNDRVRRRYARALWARLHTPEFLALGGRTAWLLRAIRPFCTGDASANTAPKNATLWHVDGRVVSGSQPVLAVETGLDPRRVRDLVCGRRPYAGGWATSPKAAAGGRRKRGRPRVETDFLDAWQTA